MSTPIRPPAARPCESCPYRRDVPSGVWDASEYDKLPRYDEPTFAQPTGVFLCHQQDGRLCAGWVGCHDVDQLLSLRLAVSAGELSVDDMEMLADYASPAPLFRSGSEAAAHGRAEIASPGESARRVITKVGRRQSAHSAVGGERSDEGNGSLLFGERSDNPSPDLGGAA